MLEAAADILRRGGLVAVPTETVYGLAADATNDLAVAQIFKAKGRPSFNPLIVHVLTKEDAASHAIFSQKALQLAQAFWPGPLTLVLPRKPESQLSHLVSAGLDTIALRAPAHPVARLLLKKFGSIFAAPSANPSGAISPTTAEHVVSGLGDKVDMILDGGPCEIGVESTIVSVLDDKVTLLRPGGISLEKLENVIGEVAIHAHSSDEAIQAPGMMTSHYAPKTRVRLMAKPKNQDGVFLGFGEVEGAGAHDLNLSPAGDLTEAAANLFSYLHQLDALGHDIYVAPVPVKGLGVAINDRLARAAADKTDD